jgi:hypothetical protein
MIFHLNDTVITLSGVKEAIGGAVPENLTVTATLRGPGETIGPIVMSHTTGGTYQGLVPFDAGLKLGHRYRVEVTAAGGPGKNGFWAPELTVTARS